MDKSAFSQVKSTLNPRSVFSFVVGQIYLDHVSEYKVLSKFRGMVEIERPTGERGRFDEKIKARIHTNLQLRHQPEQNLKNVDRLTVDNILTGSSHSDIFAAIAGILERLSLKKPSEYVSHAELAGAIIENSELGYLITQIVAADPDGRNNEDWAAHMIGWFSQAMATGKNSCTDRFEQTQIQPFGYRLKLPESRLSATATNSCRIVEFEASEDEEAHGKFQDWRRKTDSGFFLNLKSEKRAMLHRALCSHPGDTSWEEGGLGGNLTTMAKICANDREMLLGCARSRTISVNLCRTCKP